MSEADSQTNVLLARAATGDASAGESLLLRHQERLRKMIAVRLDRRLAGRLDPSDVLQEVFAEAARELPAYAQRQPVPFYPWLRQIAWERLVKLHQRHLFAAKRAASRETALPPTDESVVLLADRLVDPGTSPSIRVVRAEMRDRVRAALEQLPDRDREVLVMRYLEQLSMAEIAAVVGSTEGAIKVRHLRAIERLRNRLGEEE
jgi:RNA polymerase sigma-70 factor (ECF subfamily)